MLFRKKMERSCEYCRFGTALEGGRVLCAKKGDVEIGSCRRFSYDPCKRVPPRPAAPDFAQFEGEDFSL
ncbi:MAG: hypothetical protein LUH51_02345 [Firmicutes bacterium]|nr:hypothetical protein [Bacillota bacterium]